MEIQLRIILLVVGLLILFIVGLDLYRRKSLRTSTGSLAGTNNTSNELLSAIVAEQNNTAESSVMLSDDALSSNFVELEQQLELEPTTQVNMFANNSEPKIAEVETAPQPVVAVSLMARNRFGFAGDHLLRALTNANLHFGKNDIFHRFEHDDGTGAVLFSLVKAVEPGYFHLDLLKQEHVPGVTLILLPNKVVSPAMALDKMIRAAKQMAFTLNAELLDHERKPLTLTTIEKYRTQVKTK